MTQRSFFRTLCLSTSLFAAAAVGFTACSTRGPTSGGGNTGGQPGGEEGGADSGGSGGGSDTGGSSDSSADGEGDSGQPAVEANLCQEQCSENEDCANGFHCDGGRCKADASVTCDADEDCVPILSGWVTACDSSEECTTGPCVDVGGDGGVCATAPSEFFTCDTIGQATAERETVEGTTVEVCAQTAGRCAPAKYCFIPCTPDYCLEKLPETPICNSDTGFCECDESSCATNSSVCIEGACRCASDSDCTTGAVDTCYGGVCGCATANSCEDMQTAHPGTIVVCEPIPE